MDTRGHGPLTFLANQSLAQDLIQSGRRRVTSQIKILPRRLLIDIEGVAGRGIDEESGMGVSHVTEAQTIAPDAVTGPMSGTSTVCMNIPKIRHNCIFESCRSSQTDA